MKTQFKYARVRIDRGSRREVAEYIIMYDSVNGITGGSWPGIMATKFAVLREYPVWIESEGFFPLEHMHYFSVIQYKNIPKELKGKE